MSATHEDNAAASSSGEEKDLAGHNEHSTAPVDGTTNGKAAAANIPRNYTVSQVYNPEFNKLANPGPLGLFGFAVTAFTLGVYECGAG